MFDKKEICCAAVTRRGRGLSDGMGRLEHGKKFADAAAATIAL